MKRIICLLLVMGILFLGGCTPIETSVSGDTANSGTKTTSQTDKSKAVKKPTPAITPTSTPTASRQPENDAAKDSVVKDSVDSNIEIDKTGAAETDISGKAGSDSGDETVAGKVENSDVGNKDSTILHITLYYQDRERNIIPVTRSFARQEGIARAAVCGLVDNPINREELEYYGIYPVLPQGTEIIGLTIRDGRALVDFNSKLLDYKDDTSERNIVSSIVYTLTEFKNVKEIKILVNGQAQKALKYNTDISGILSRENVLVNSKKLNLEKGSGKVDLYLFKSINDKEVYIIPLSIQEPEINEENMMSRLIELMASKQEGKKLYTEIPANTKLLGSSIKGDVIILDFNREIRNYGGNAREEGILKQILYSVKQFEGVRKVKILIEGKEDYLTEGTDISKELDVPQEINEVEIE